MPKGARCQRAPDAKGRQMPKSARCQRAPDAKEREMPKGARCQRAINAKQQPEPANRNALAAALYWLRDLMLSVVIAVLVILFLYQPVKVEGTVHVKLGVPLTVKPLMAVSVTWEFAVLLRASVTLDGEAAS